MKEQLVMSFGLKSQIDSSLLPRKLLLKAASLLLEAEVFLRLSLPVVPPMKTSSAAGSIIQ